MNADFPRGKSGTLQPFLAATLLLFTLGISLPGTLYLTNPGEFSISATDLWVVAAPMFLLALAVAALLIRSLGILRRPRFVAVLFALALLVWIQGHVLVWQYGPLDGRVIDWTSYRWNGVVDGSLWVLVLSIALWKPLPFYKAIGVVVPTLLALQMMVLGVATVRAGQADDAGSIKAYHIDASSKFELSRDRNAILIVLDEAQSSTFGEIVAGDAAYGQIFDGFTYFPDALAGANYTELAIPALMTGEIYDNTVPRDRYMERAYLERSIPAVLKRNGFHVEIYPWEGWGNASIYFDAALADNLEPVRDSKEERPFRVTEAAAKEIVHLEDLALFRAAPHFVKPHVYNNQRWFLMGILSRMLPESIKHVGTTDDMFETTVFAERAVAEARVGRTGDAFFYYHLKGAHSPLTVTPDLMVGPEPVATTRENYVLQYQASLQGLGRVFARLKALGIYDKSLIVIVGDHGSGSVEDLYVNSPEGARPRELIDPGAARRNFRKDKARGLPLVLVKPLGSNGPLSVSEKPVSLLDLPATVESALGVEASLTAFSMLDESDQGTRLRHYAAIDYSEIKISYVGSITLYEISGDAREDESWTLARILTPPAEQP